MQKITEITETYFVKRRNRNGGTEPEKVKMTRFREVKYIEGGSRFGHYLLDFLFLLGFRMLFWVTIGLILGLTNNVHLLQDSIIGTIETVVNWLFLLPFYYFIFELSMQSTPGKALFGRIVVDEYGNKPTPRQLLIRSVSRIVPFEALSCLSTLGWHDKWSNTFVLHKKELAELKLLQKVNEIGDTSVPLQP